MNVFIVITIVKMIMGKLYFNLYLYTVIREMYNKFLFDYCFAYFLKIKIGLYRYVRIVFV